MNIPLNKNQVNQLPMGFNITSDGFNRKRRRSKEFKKIISNWNKMSMTKGVKFENDIIELEKQLTEVAFTGE